MSTVHVIFFCFFVAFLKKVGVGKDFNQSKKLNYDKIFQEKRSENSDLEEISVDTIMDLRNQIDQLQTRLGSINKENELNESSIEDTKGKIENYDEFINQIKSNKNLIYFLNFSKNSEFRLSPPSQTKDFAKELQQSICKDGAESKEYKTQTVEIDINELAEKMEKQQRESLTEDEIEALHIYKSCAYTSMNAIKKDLAERGEITENTLHILEKEYFDLKDRLDNPEKHKSQNEKMKLVNRDSNLIDTMRLLRKSTGSLEQYIDKMKHWCINADSAFDKVKTEEDIIVYRGAIAEELSDDKTLGSDISRDKFISTTTDPKVARQFWSNRGIDPQDVLLYKIKIPKGTPAIFYTSCLFEKDQTKSGFPDSQKEVLLDGSNLDIIIEQIRRVNTTLHSPQTSRNTNEDPRSKQIRVIECSAKDNKVIDKTETTQR